MSVIIRLQNLPWAANAADIRQYFQGLSIPEGGVHIVGGEKGDAFISFSTDEDARQAMLSDGGYIKEAQIRLLLSSRNEMQKVIETARLQTLQLTQVYMQQLHQPQIPIVGSLPPLTAKVLPQPQQPVRPDRMINNMYNRMDGPGMLSVPLDKQHLQPQQQQQLQPQPQQQQQHHQQQQQQQQLLQLQQHPHLSPKLLENKERDDKGHKRERTRSKSRDRRSKSSRSGGGGGSRRDRSRSRDRRRRDRSRGRDRSRDRYHGGAGRNSSSHGSGGGKPHRSRSPGGRVMAEGGGKAGMQGDLPQQQQQQASVRSWNCQFDNGAQPHAADGQPHPMANSGPGGVGHMQQFGQFRTPPQPPIIASMPPSQFKQQQQQQPLNPHDWTSGGGDQQPYEPDNNFRSTVYGAGSDDDDDDEDDRQAEYDNGYHRRYNNDNAGGPPTGMRRGPPGQDYNQQQHGYGGGPNNRGPRFHQKQPGGPQNRGGHRQFDDFRGGGGGGPRFNNSHHQQQQQPQPPPRYGRGGISGGGISDGGGGRPSRFSSVHDGGRPSRFNPVAPQHRNDGDEADFSADDSGNKRPAPRFNDRYRYDVRNAAAPQQAAVTARADGLCVEVNNMSNHFSYGDVRKLFDGIHIDGSAIKIQKHRQGVAFVRFDNNHNKNLALRVNGNLYKGNHIAVKHLDDEAYERDNTDDRPYPSTVAAATPTIVDHVDLVDDDDDDDDDGDGGGQKSTAPAQKKSDDGIATAGGEKNDAPAATEADGEEQRNKTQQPQQQQQQQQPDPPTKYLQLKQLPVTVTEEEVLNEIDGGGDVRRVTFYPDGEFMGAALEFNNVDAAEAALKRFDCVLLGSTPVPVLRCTYKEYVQIKRKSGGGGRRFSGDGGGRHHHHHHQSHVSPSSGPQQQQQQPPPPPVHPVPPVVRSNCVYVYGLPTTVTNTDITQFFGETSVLPDKIHIMLSKFGRPTGESYCEFGTAQQAQTAMSKDQCYMGPNLVYVEPISRSIMIQAITKPMQQINHPPDMSWGPGGGPRQPHGGGGGGPRHQHHHGGRGPAQQQQQSFGPGGGGGHNGPYARPQYMNNGGARGGGGGGSGYTPRMRGPGPGPNTGPDGFGQPGCVVALDNVPYRADVQEIVDFFDGFELNSQNVIRRFNDFGKPTGEARVNLRNPQEAARAVRTLQTKPIFNRPVRLTLL